MDELQDTAHLLHGSSRYRRKVTVRPCCRGTINEGKRCLYIEDNVALPEDV
jgi:hypothetical protein